MGIVIGLIAAIIVAALAASRGRNAIGWFFIGLVCWPLGLILLFVMPNMNEQRARDQHVEDENRRLREQLQQERIKNETFRQHATARLDAHDQHIGIDTRSTVPALGSGQQNAQLGAGDADRPADMVGDEGVKWFYDQGSGTHGPCSTAEMRGLIIGGRITGDTLVWAEHLQEWRALRLVPEFEQDMPT